MTNCTEKNDDTFIDEQNSNSKISNNPKYLSYEKLPIIHEKNELYIEKNIKQQANSNEVR